MSISNISILNITLGIHYIIRSSIRFNIMMEHIFHPFEAYLTLFISELTQKYLNPTHNRQKNPKKLQKRHKSTTNDKNLVHWLLHRRTKSLFWCLRKSLQALKNLYERYKTFYPHIMIIITMIMVMITSSRRK